MASLEVASVLSKKVTFLVPTSYSDVEQGFTSEDSDSTSSHRLNAKGAFGNKHSPNKNASPKKTRITRDTLNGRIRKRKGKPGSRKHHRWENEKSLGRREDELSDTGPLEDEMEAYLFNSNNQNIFFRMFEEPELYDAWRPFFDITEEEETLLHQFDEESEEDDEIFCSRPDFAFERLTAEGRRSVKKYSTTEFLSDLDNVVHSFIIGNTSEIVSDTFSWSLDTSKLVLVMRDSFHRMMAHTVCAFYNAASSSEFVGAPKRKMISVALPTDSKFTPKETLLEYLKKIECGPVHSWDTPIEEVQSSKQAKKGKGKGKERRRQYKISIDDFANETQDAWSSFATETQAA